MNPGKINVARDFIRRRDSREPACLVVLGSGLGSFADASINRKIIAFDEIPGFPSTSVSGHSGRLVIGEIEGKTCSMMQGRFHLYEGLSVEDVVFPIRVLLGICKPLLIITNAAGGINPDLYPGDLMMITDQLNLTGYNPLTGPNETSLGPRFLDMSKAYSERLAAIAKETAGNLSIRLKEGIYAGCHGPSYETPAEIRMMRTFGADAVSMSTVNEVIAARQMGAEVLGISCITNNPQGMEGRYLSHDDVLKTAENAGKKFAALLSGIIGRL